MIRVTFALLLGSALPLPTQMVAQPLGQAPAEQTTTQTMTEAATQLAARTSSLLPRRTTVSLEWQNLTPLPAAEWSSFRHLLQDELRKIGLETAATSPDSRVRVTLSENARGLLFVAEIFTGNNRQIVMLPWALPSPAQGKPRISLMKKALWAQPEPILDVLFVDSNTQMLVLSTNKVASYRLMGDHWAPSATASLALPRPMPRDPRGRLEATAGGFEAFLPVATCAGAWNPDLKLACASGIASWPGTFGMHWVADRNVLEGDAPTPSFEGWGSDWLSSADPCGAGTVVIASSAKADREELRVFDVSNGQATAASDALPLPGPVTALWPAESQRNPPTGSATLVVRNPQTGDYEASRLGLACAQ